MKRTGFILLALSLALSLPSCKNNSTPQAGGGLPYPVEVAAGDLYERFREPGSDSRLFVRWWWNGTRVTEQEILRELDVMKGAGIGGVEINSIAFPEQAYPDTLGLPQIEWLSDEWLRMVEVAAKGAKERGMYADLIVGSGWPFGGEFLSRDQQIKMLTLETMEFTGPAKVEVGMDEIIARAQPAISHKYEDGLAELVDVRMVPYEVSRFTPGTKLAFDPKAQSLAIDVPEGKHSVYFVVKLTGYMKVIHGAAGAKGPVLDHYNKEAVSLFLGRMSAALKKVFGNIGDYIRSFFTDSLELEGSNWCDDFFEEFRRRRGYDAEPYMPFVLKKVGRMGDEIKGTTYGARFSPEAQEEIARVRYDWDITLAELFKERFLDVMIAWCRENGVRSRMQAYGRGYFHIESSMEIDIPECETWYSEDIKFNDDYPRGGVHGAYSMSNKFVASGAHLVGNRVVSCEEITNTRHVFDETLERIKIVGDMSNLSGVSHSIFHGFNYSPPEAAFPGWIRYGAYLSERNPLWRFFPAWTDYKARLSTVFVNAEMQGDIAIVHPIADLWTYKGTQRDPFPGLAHPEYAHNMWEAINQNGGGCDYLSENVLQGSKFRDGRILYGPRSYKALIMMEVETVQPGTLEAIEKYAKAGGKVFFVGKDPSRSPGLKGLGGKDAQVRAKTAELKQKYPQSIFSVEAPEVGGVIEWYARLQREHGLTPYVSIDNPSKYVSQTYYKTGGLDIFFFSNYDLEREYTLQPRFNIDLAGRRAWLWDAETGERAMLPETGAELTLRLGPAQSRLIVFDKPGAGAPVVTEPVLASPAEKKASWDVVLTRFDGTATKITMKEPSDIAAIKGYHDFAGEIVYETRLDVSPGECRFMEFTVDNCVSELYVNGTKAGTTWYGRHLYDVGALLKEGGNDIRLVLTTNLGNYALANMDNHPAYAYWAGRRVDKSYDPCGLTGDVRIYR